LKEIATFVGVKTESNYHEPPEDLKNLRKGVIRLSEVDMIS